MIRELDQVVLDRELPEHRLARGDLGTVLLVHDQGGGYDVEFTALDGETLAVATLSSEQVREVGHHEIAHARGLANA